MTSSLLIGLSPLAQALPLSVIMAADDRCAGLLDPAYLAVGVQKRIRIPGIARRRIGIEAFAQARRVRREQKRPVAIEVNGGPKRTRRVAGQRDQYQFAVTEHIPFAAHGINGLFVVPIGSQIARQPPGAPPAT